MKEYYKADNELVKQVVDFFDREDGDKSLRKEFEIGGKKWYASQLSPHLPLMDGSPRGRMTGEVLLQQSDGTKHPTITLHINVGSGH